MKARDINGWRIPRAGSRTEQIYDLMIAGFTTREIVDLFQEDINKSSVGVLIHGIKYPARHNESSYRWRKNNANKLKKQHGSYSSYVLKLVKTLGISYTEAVAIERKERKC